MTVTRACPECGAVFGKSRSRAHHNRLFALIEVACENWPEDHEFQPEDDPERLRAWLLCKAGYSERKDVPVEYSENNPELAKETAIAIQAAFGWAGAYAFVRPHPGGGLVAIYRAKSIKWSKLSQKDFAPLAEAVEQVIENVIGVNAETLLKEHEKAA